MKGIIGYLLLGAGLGAIVFRIAEIDNAPQWKAWLVLVFVIEGLSLIIENSKKETKEEIREEIENRF